MKKIALFMAVAVLAIACKPQEEIVPEVKVTSTEETLVIPTEGGEAVISFDSNVEWTAELEVLQDAADPKSWCTITPASGAAGSNSIKVIAVENGTNDGRTASVLIKAQSASARAIVKQLQKDALVLEGEKTFEVGMDGGEVKFAVNANVALDAVPDVDWITTTKAMTKTEYVFNVAANTGAARSGKIVVSSGNLKEEVTVNQAAWTPIFEVAPAEDQWIALEGGSVSITVNANVEYTVTTDDNNWLTVSNEGGVYTFTAPANDAFDYRAVGVYVTPKDPAYVESAKAFYVFQNGRAGKLWTKLPAVDIQGFDASKPSRLAKYGDFILLANTSKVYALNPADGTVAATYNVPEGFDANSLCVDDANNIILANNIGPYGVMNIYTIADPSNPKPELIRTYNGDYYASSTGNLRVKGNIKETAVMAATASEGAGGAGIYWNINKGECSTWYAVNPAYEVGDAAFGCFAPLGNKYEDGFLYIGYGVGGTHLDLQYLATPIPDSRDNVWKSIYNPGITTNENLNCIATAEYKGKKYAAITVGSHFSWCVAQAHLIDITNPEAATLIYKYDASYDVVRNEDWSNASWTGLGTYSDILLVPTADALLMVYLDSNYGSMSCIAIR